MYDFFLRPGFWFLVAFLLAALEVEIEGPNGWASALPTARIENRLVLFLVRPFFGGRPVTLYHAYLFSLLFVFSHAAFIQGLDITWRYECRILSSFFLLAVTWDYLWFVLNPAFGPDKFAREHVAWHAHRRWLFKIFPIDYVIGFALSMAFWVLGCVSDDANVFDVVNGALGYLVWAFLMGFVVTGPDASYRKWRGAKKSEGAWRDAPVAPSQPEPPPVQPRGIDAP